MCSSSSHFSSYFAFCIISRSKANQINVLCALCPVYSTHSSAHSCSLSPISSLSLSLSEKLYSFIHNFNPFSFHNITSRTITTTFPFSISIWFLHTNCIHLSTSTHLPVFLRAHQKKSYNNIVYLIQNNYIDIPPPPTPPVMYKKYV